MKKKQGKLMSQSFISKFLAFLMVFTLIAPATGSASYSDENKQKPTSIHENLTKAFEKDEFVKFLVLLDEQTDTQSVALQAEKSAKKLSLSKVDTKKMKQEAVVSELLKTAKKSQKDISSLLTKEQKSGQVKEFQSFYIVNGFAVEGNKKIAEKLASLPGVKSVTLDEKHKLLPTDEKDFQITTADPLSDEVEWNINRIKATDVWEKGYKGEGTVIASIDSGVDGNHPALKTQYRGYNPDNPNNPSHEFNWYDAVSGRLSPMDSDGHGTHTMGTMIGQEPDGTNKIGVAPGAKWISTRAFFLGETHDSYLLNAAEWVLAPKDANGVPHPEMAPDVVNNSWGGGPLNNDWYRPAVQAWRAVEIVPIFSVGNAGLFADASPGSASAPANYPESIAVGATDENDDLAWFSLRGPSERGDLKPDISAPGVNIRSSIPGPTWDTFAYGLYNGTSMAAPQVAATALFLRQVDPTLTVDQIEDILKMTATTKVDDAYPTAPNNGYGFGLVDAKAAVEAVEQGIATINGQVIGTGTDGEAPTFKHEKRAVVFEGEESHFSVQAMDNVSVDNVTLTILSDDETEKTYETKRTKGDHKNGTYEVVVPPTDITGESLKYWWTLTDFSGNTTESDQYEVAIEQGVTNGYVQNFERYPDGWYSFGINNSWEWGVPKFGPPGAVSGEKVMGTNLRGQYEMNSDMTLVMPPVFPEANTILRFNQWYSLSWFGEDMGTIYASTDGERWEQLHRITKDNKQWHEVGINLSKYAGQKIYIAFNLTSQVNQFEGWYIDDVRLVNSEAGSTSESSKTSEKRTISTPKKVSYPQSTEVKPEVTETDLLPVNATIEVVETGWKTTTNEQNGKFTIHHPPGDYSLKINAYGFESKTEQVTLTEKGIITPTITLDASPIQTVSGTVKDSFGGAIKDATIFLLDEENAPPVKSHANGQYNLNVYEGTYTLKVHAPGYYSETKQITVNAGENIDLNIELRTFISDAPSEIKYDNGRYNKNLAFGLKGNGFAVKMSIDENETAAMLTGAKLQFWAGHVPVPGGNDIHIAIYDATGKDGAPGNKLAGPINAKADRNLSRWTQVDLSNLGIVVQDDFYVVYLQADDYPYVPGFVADGDQNNWAARSWDYIGGQWVQSAKSYGNYMIRAVVDYGQNLPDLVKPVITAPDENIITNEEAITIEGTATPSSTIRLLNNGIEAEVAETDDNGNFTIPTTLSEGENEFKAVTLHQGSPVIASDSVAVVLDTIKPAITITNPKDGDVTNQETITVEGTVVDKNLDFVKVNGHKATVTDGNFANEIQLRLGFNDIEVIAQDLAGNKETKTITIEYNEDTYPFDEIGYDDGTAEMARVFLGEGNGWAVKMSLPEDEESATITNGLFHIGDIANGNEFMVEIWDASGKFEKPGKKIAGPFAAVADNENEWVSVDLGDQNITVDSDFYMVYIQPKAGRYSPFLSTDQSSPHTGRSYQYIGGSWEATPEAEGNYMIRTRVIYEESKPVITLPENNLVTNQTDLSVEGTATPGSTIKLFKNDKEAGTAEVNENGTFTVPVNLTEGKNKLAIISTLNGTLIGKSDPVVVTLDTTAPELTIETPKDGDVIDQLKVMVEGTVVDENLEFVTVNGKEATVTGENYSQEVNLKNGVNEIEVVAKDLAGNTETTTVTIEVEVPDPVITNLQPARDQHVTFGDEIEISFESSEGGEASFSIVLPALSAAQETANKMVEVEPGVYKGTWTVPANLNLQNAVIQVAFKDAVGNKITDTAKGKITVYETQVNRISNDTRYSTAIEISKKGWTKSDTVVLARGDNYADALAGVPYAHQLDAPILLTLTNNLYEETLAEIQRLGAKKVVILGGESAISAEVAGQLKSAGLTVDRISGSDRFETAAKIASEMGTSDKAVIANGMDFPDALSVAAHAAKAGLPILLTQTDKLPAKTLEALETLGATETIVVGGKTVVSDKVVNQLPNPTTLSGADRYETNIAVAEHFGVTNKHIYIATGQNYADALTGAVLAAKNDGAVLLVHARIPEIVTTYITDEGVKRLTIFGGESAVSKKVANDLEKLIQ